MKILFVCDYFPPFAPGGAEWSSYYLAKALAKNKNIKLTILTPNYGSLSFESKKDGYKIIRFPFIFKLKAGQKTLPFFINNNIFYYFYSAFWITKIALKEKVDLIHLQSRFSLPGAVLAKLILQKPLVFTLRNTNFFCPTGVCLQRRNILKKYSQFSHFWSKCSREYISQYIKPKTKFAYFYIRLSLLYFWFDNWLKKSFLKLTDRLIFISQALKKLYLKADLVKSDKSKVIYNLPPLEIKLVDQKIISQLKKKLNLENKKIVLFAGRLTLGKGVYDLIKTADLVYKKNKQTVFLFIGKGKIESGLPVNVRIISSLFHQKLFDFYQLVDVVVVPTKGFEPFGRIPQEAALFKKPVIITRSGGLVEQIVDKKTGLIVPRNEPEKVASAILKLLKNRDLRKKMGQNHLKYVKQRFNQEKIIKELLLIYQSLR